MPGVRLIKFYLSTFECYDLDENDNLRISISLEIHQRKEHCDCQLRNRAASYLKMIHILKNFISVLFETDNLLKEFDFNHYVKKNNIRFCSNRFWKNSK